MKIQYVFSVCILVLLSSCGLKKTGHGFPPTLTRQYKWVKRTEGRAKLVNGEYRFSHPEDNYITITNYSRDGKEKLDTVLYPRTKSYNVSYSLYDNHDVRITSCGYSPGEEYFSVQRVIVKEVEGGIDCYDLVANEIKHDTILNWQERFDSRGRLVSNARPCKDGRVFLDYYTYDADDRCVMSKSYSTRLGIDIAGIEPSRITTYVYDDRGYLMSESVDFSDGAHWLATYDYDFEHMKVTHVSTNKNSHPGKTVMYFDEYGGLVKRLEFTVAGRCRSMETFDIVYYPAEEYHEKFKHYPFIQKMLTHF